MQQLGFHNNINILILQKLNINSTFYLLNLYQVNRNCSYSRSGTSYVRFWTTAKASIGRSLEPVAVFQVWYPAVLQGKLESTALQQDSSHTVTRLPFSFFPHLNFVILAEDTSRTTEVELTECKNHESLMLEFKGREEGY